jgi:hypothetical protein
VEKIPFMTSLLIGYFSSSKTNNKNRPPEFDGALLVPVPVLTAASTTAFLYL